LSKTRTAGPDIFESNSTRRLLKIWLSIQPFLLAKYLTLGEFKKISLDPLGVLLVPIKTILLLELSAFAQTSAVMHSFCS
jgi:hypothetical protein